MQGGVKIGENVRYTPVFFLTYRVKLGRMRIAFSESGKGDCFCGFFKAGV